MSQLTKEAITASTILFVSIAAALVVRKLLTASANRLDRSETDLMNDLVRLVRVGIR